MKGLLLLILYLPPALVVQEPPTKESFPTQTALIPGDAQEYTTFIQKLDEFNRKLGGCPKRGSLETCYAPRGVYDAKLWKDLCKRAEKIFHFPRPKNK